MTDPLAPLRARFRARAAADRLELDALDDVDLGGDRLRRLAHNLAGAAGMFGHEALGAAALEVDDQLTASHAADPASVARLKRELDALATEAEP